MRCKEKLLDVSQPLVMGILNTTPDSFYSGSRVMQHDAALKQCEKMLLEGASIIDVGGASSRPQAQAVSLEEELQRSVPLIEILVRSFPDAIFSIDTYRAAVARAAVGAGASIVNDISGGALDKDILPTVAELQVPYILMHIQGTPQTMQKNPTYGDDIVLDITDYFIQKIQQLQQLDIQDIILDVGFGFGKTATHNFELLRRLREFTVWGYPLLAGVSRKSMIWRTLHGSPETALNGTTALNMTALLQGAKILRVHDVWAARETIALYQQLYPSSSVAAE